MRRGPERVVLKEGSGFQLICLSFAGGSARSFTRLARMTDSDWNVVAVQPPSGYDDQEICLDALAHFYCGLLASDLRGPGIVLGHSLGAAVAHRMAQVWSAGWPRDLHLVLSAPAVPEAPTGDLLELEDRVLLSKAGRMGMLPDLQTSEDFALRLLLPSLKSDLAVLRTRGWTPAPVDAPLHLLGGERDPMCPPAVWSSLQESLRPLSSRQIPGSHLYVVEQPAPAVEFLREVAHGITAGGGPRAAARDGARPTARAA